MKQLWTVNWYDPRFPEIRPTDDPAEGVSLTAAKEQITDHCSEIISHWREIARLARGFKPSKEVSRA